MLLDKHLYLSCYKFRQFSKSSLLNITTIKIGSVIKSITRPLNPELVPIKFMQEKENQTKTRHLQWMLQKDCLGQDMFLMGPPGSYRRKLAMSFAELTQREIEYISLSRDTTEADLKQRREIIHGNAVYIDQAALRAATKGRILILDGIEKAERNVLPILNNLLENREMQLEDGRFLMRSNIYDKLLGKYSHTELNRWKFIRCDDRFRIIALGLPVPLFKGNSLDPPLRSRFQSRFVRSAGDLYEEMLHDIQNTYPNISINRITRILSFIHALDENKELDILPQFPMNNVISAIGLLSSVPAIEDYQLIQWMYPFEFLINKSNLKMVGSLLNKFQITIPQKVTENYKMAVTYRKDDPKNSPIDSVHEMVITENIENIITQLSWLHSIGDFCVIGPEGCGKSMIVSALAARMGAAITHVVLYGDMTSREILQQRETVLETGDTVWRNSALVRASMEGHWAVLEGLDRLDKGCLATLNQLVTDRQLQLFDGSRLIRHDRYDTIKIAENWSDKDMANRGIYRIHPNFRIIALANLPAIPGESSSSSNNRTEWLTPEVMTAFRFHVIPELPRNDESYIVAKLVPKLPTEKLERLLDVVHKLRTSEDSQIRDLSQTFSIRQILRISNRLANYPTETITNSIHKACLSKFLPKIVKDSLTQSLEEFEDLSKCYSTDDQLSDTEKLTDLINKYTKMQNPYRESVSGEDEAKVPNILFYESVAHTRILLEMLQDCMMTTTFNDKQHLLLIGNQGVGKNKIVDRFLQLLNRPREYIQLHRDTTVQNLTLQPSIKNGRLIFEDSALVTAISKGRVLVIDEADKASTQVTCILKTLVSLGEMELSDGRRIIPENRSISHLTKEQQEMVIRIHSDFRMIVLANRPGFPFLGNDFFGSIGDVFSCHVVDNPDIISEIKMLQNYGPSVPNDIIKKLVYLFSDLRDLADKGQINYPYSTREIVNIVKHLEVYPNDSLPAVLGNVFDFDVSNKEMLSTIESTLEKHGISLPGSKVKLNLARELLLPPLIIRDKWFINSKSPKSLSVVSHESSVQNSFLLNLSKTKVKTEITRSRIFSELDECVSIKLGEYNVLSDMIASGVEGTSHHSNAYIHLVTLNPIVLTTLTISKDSQGNCNKLSSQNHASQIDLSDSFPPVHGSFRPLITLSALSYPLESSVILFESTTNKILQINTESGEILPVDCSDCLPENKVKPRPNWFNIKEELNNQKEHIKMHKDWSTDSIEPIIIFHKPGDKCIRILNILEKSWLTITTEFPIQTLNMIDKYKWLIQDSRNRLFMIVRDKYHNQKYTMNNIDTENKSFVPHNIFADKINISDFKKDFKLALGTSVTGFGKSAESFVDIFPHMSEKHQDPILIYSIPRSSPLSSTYNHASTNALLKSSGVVVGLIHKNSVPKQFKNAENYTSISGYLEVVDIKSQTVKYLQVPSVFEEPMTFQWLKTNIPDIFVARLQDDLITMDNTGCIHKWTICPSKLQNELDSWKSLIGVNSDESRNLMIERLDKDINTELSDPKHGKVDPTGAPHVGGNTWAGGTGGRDTAGLGGIGGPYRLDSGHSVFQVSDKIKAAVPDHIKAAAREVAEKAWKERLNNIKMSELDYDLYMRYYKRVESHIISIKALLDTLQATSKERQWIRHRTHGDLDDGKLVEGVLGEKSIFRARGEKDPEPGSPQVKPKRLRVVCDLSGSMYRFNGYDQRLERQMEAILMLMESFANAKNDKLIYDIYGHSGEGPQFPFVKLNKSPINEKQRMDVLNEMLAHSQFCLSGDHTLEAIDIGIRDLKTDLESVDQSFLIVLSDANLARYGIQASSVTNLLLRDKEINSFIIFIGSLGDQAQLLKKALPAGHSFVCMDIETLPQILRNIFTTNLL